MDFEPIVGSAEDDVFVADPDVSTEIDGGDGVDEVVYAGAFEDYTFSLNGYVLEITKPGGSVDRLIDIEYISFATLPAPYSYHQLLNELATVGDDQIRMPSGLDYEVVDVVDGKSGSDTFHAGGTAMIVDGGGAEYDQVNYPGAAADYVFRQTGLNDIEVSRPDGVVDKLSDIDGVWFLGEQTWYAIDDLVSVATYEASDGDDQIFGSKGDDVIQGAAGADTFYESAGDNVLIGAAYEFVGDDLVLEDDFEYDQINYDGRAADYTFIIGQRYQGAFGFIKVIRPDGGVDLLHGVDGVWFIDEGAWYAIEDLAAPPPALTGTNNPDVMTLPDEPETFSYDGLSGDDQFISNNSVSAYINGGPGRDQVVYPGDVADYEILLNDPEPKIVKPGGAVDTLSSVESFRFGSADSSYLELLDALLTNADDSVYLPIGVEGPHNHTIDAKGGEDVFVAGDGGLTVDGGGDEYDQINYPGLSGDYIFTQIGVNVVSVQRPDGATDTLLDVDGVWFQDEQAWYALEDLIARAEYKGTIGDDVLTGSVGDDKLQGWLGSDTFVVDAGDNVLVGGAYIIVDGKVVFETDDDVYDQINYEGRAEDYTIIAGQTYLGADGFYRVIRPDGGEDLIHNIEGVWFFGESAWYSVEELALHPSIIGTPGDDYIFGDAGDNVIQGGEGEDKIAPEAGNNVVFGGSFHMDGDQLIIDPDSAYDQIDYEGGIADYQFIGSASYLGVEGFVQVVRPDGGIDLLNGIEGVWFGADQTWSSLSDITTINGFSNTDFDFFAIAGQSNAERYFFRSAGDDSPGELGFEVFQDALESLSGFSTELIDAAKSGSGSNENADPVSYWWDLANDAPGPELLAAIDAINAAISEGGDLDGIIWAQGEDDARLIESLTMDGPQVAADLKYATTKVFETFWAAFGEDVPIFIQHLATDFPENPSSYVDGPGGALALIRQVQEELVAELGNVFFGADPTGKSHFDSIHFTNEAYGEIAQDLAQSIYDQFTSAASGATSTTAMNNDFVAQKSTLAPSESVLSKQLDDFSSDWLFPSNPMADEFLL